MPGLFDTITADPRLPGLLGGTGPQLTPDQRRKLAARALTAQFDRATPQDTEVVERASMFPLGTYANGMTGPALPGFITQPFESFKRLVDQGYESGNPQSAEDAFNVAGAAMVGGLAAPRPRGSLGMSGRPEGAALNAAGERAGPMRVYHGTSAAEQFDKFNRPPWMTENPAIASGAAFSEMSDEMLKEFGHLLPQYNRGRVFPLDIEPKNPFVVDQTAGAEPFRSAFEKYGYPYDGAAQIDPHSAAAKMGHDFFIYKNAGSDFGVNQNHSQIVPLQPGTVKSATTGETLYANGGRPGAAVGAAANAEPQDNRQLKSILDKYGLGHLLNPTDWARKMQPGDA